MRTPIVTMLIVAVLWTCVPPAWANKPRAVVVVAGNISIRDILDQPPSGFQRLIESGSAGLMNVRTGRTSRDVETVPPGGMEPGCVSLGTGAMAVAGAEARRASDAHGLVQGAVARELHHCRTGVDAGSAAVVHTEIAWLRRANASAAYRAAPGALGGALRKAGVATVVIGSSDLPGEMRREIAAVAMDENGLVDLGTVSRSRLNTPDPSAPFGVRVNTAALLAELDRALESHTISAPDISGCFVVIGFADTFRADTYAELCLDHRAAINRRRAAARLGELVSAVIERLDLEKDLFVLVSPNSRTFSDMGQERLAPVIMCGAGYRGGVLTSPSTRTEGVVTISDFAPTILQFFGLQPPPVMVGRPIRSAPRSDAPEFLLALNLQSSAQASRQAIMRGGSVAQSVVVAAVTLVALAGITGAARKAAAWVALIPVAMPVSMLCLPLVYSGGLAESAALLTVLTAGIIAVCFVILQHPTRSLAWLCGVILITLTLDLARGGRLIAASISGYSIVEGARYYGIGNELMGTMLGASLVGVGAALSGSRIPARLRGAFAACVYLAVFVFIGASNLGANAGGALAAAPAMAAALLTRRETRVTARGVALATAGVVALAAGLFALDALRSTAAQSHVGRAAGMAAGGGLWEVISILQRKISLNLMLVKTSLWSRLLALSLVGSAAMAAWGRDRLAARLTREQLAAAIGCCAGVIGAFAFNDSGVVAAATCSVALWAMLAVVSLDDQPDDAWRWSAVIPRRSP